MAQEQERALDAVRQFETAVQSIGRFVVTTRVCRPKSPNHGITAPNANRQARHNMHLFACNLLGIDIAANHSSALTSNKYANSCIINIVQKLNLTPELCRIPGDGGRRGASGGGHAAAHECRLLCPMAKGAAAAKPNVERHQLHTCLGEKRGQASPLRRCSRLSKIALRPSLLARNARRVKRAQNER